MPINYGNVRQRCDNVSRMKLGLRLGLWMVGLWLVVWAGDWEGPQEVLHVRQLNEFYGVHGVDSTSTTHYAWCNGTDGHMYYRALKRDGTLSPVLRLSEQIYCTGTLDISVQGTAQSVLIAFNAVRSRFPSPQCTASTPQRCSDVFYVRSSNGGANFSSPVPAPRPNLQDLVDRALPRIVTAWWQDRVWIYYFAVDAVKETTSIRSVTKPPGSTIFSNEVTAIILGDAYTFKSVYVTFSKTAKLHIQLENPAQKYAEMISIDNGITWSKPEVLKGYCEGTDPMFPAVHNGLVIVDSVFSMCLNSTSNHIYMKWSKDEGKTWTEIIRTTTDHLFENPILYSGQDKKPRLLLHHTNPNGDYKFTAYQLSQGFPSVETSGPPKCTKQAFYSADADLERKGIKVTVIDTGNANERVVKSYYHVDFTSAFV